MGLDCLRGGDSDACLFTCESPLTYSCSLSSRLFDVAIPVAITVALFFANRRYRRTHFIDLPEYVLNAQRGRAMPVAEAASSPSCYSDVSAQARLMACPECSSQVGPCRPSAAIAATSSSNTTAPVAAGRTPRDAEVSARRYSPYVVTT